MKTFKCFTQNANMQYNYYLKISQIFASRDQGNFPESVISTWNKTKSYTYYTFDLTISTN